MFGGRAAAAATATAAALESCVDLMERRASGVVSLLLACYICNSLSIYTVGGKVERNDFLVLRQKSEYKKTYSLLITATRPEVPMDEGIECRTCALVSCERASAAAIGFDLQALQPA